MSLGAFETASASGFGWNGSTVCGGNNFATCAAITVTTGYNSVTGRTLVTMTVTNLAGTNGTFAGTVFTQIGLWNLPKNNPGAAYVAGSLSVLDQSNNNVTSAWQLGTPGMNGAGIQPGVFGVDPTEGINGGLAAGDTYTFPFELTGRSRLYDVGDAGFAELGPAG